MGKLTRLNRPFLSILILLVAGIPLSAEEPLDMPETCYLFSYFVGNGEDGLHLMWSPDGRQWQALKGGQSFLQPAVGESRLMRDPCVCRTPDGTFHMVWTNGWRGTTIGYSRSRDLIDWEPQVEVPVMADEPGTLNCWAPELVYDPDKGQFLVFWASTVPSRFSLAADQREKGYNHRIYCTTTTDFKEIQPARLYFDPGFNCIDSTLVRFGHRWAMVFKDERLDPEMKNLRVAWSDGLYGPFGDVSEPFSASWVEGPTTLKIGGEWIIYYDEYTRHRYGALKTRDFVQFESLGENLVMPDGVRHGTAFPVERALIEKLLAHE